MAYKITQEFLKNFSDPNLEPTTLVITIEKSGNKFPFLTCRFLSLLFKVDTKANNYRYF